MDRINPEQHERDRQADRAQDALRIADRVAARMQANREELVERITRAVPDDGVTQVLEGLFLARASAPLGMIHGVVKPCFCVIAQGSKEFLLGDSRYRYDPDHYLIVTLEMPSSARFWKPRRSSPISVFGWILPLPWLNP